jgi:hypothetical protein
MMDLTDRCSQPLAVLMTSFAFMKHSVTLRKFVLASGG